MTQDGKYIIYGALSHDDIAVPVFPILGKHLTVRGYELFEITTVPEKLAQAKKFVFDGLASGQLKPEIDKVFAFDEMAESSPLYGKQCTDWEDFGKGLIVLR
ncbi:hypothetical protein MZA92_01950 [Haemophilus influenzae]